MLWEGPGNTPETGERNSGKYKQVYMGVGEVMGGDEADDVAQLDLLILIIL